MSEYYTCKECEDEVNRKGKIFLQNVMCYNMPRMQETFILEKKKQETSCAVTCKECGKQFLDSSKVKTGICSG